MVLKGAQDVVFVEEKVQNLRLWSMLFAVFFCVSFITFLPFVGAYSLGEVSIHDAIGEDFSLEETISLSLRDNAQTVLPFQFPSGSYDVRVGNNPISLVNGSADLPLDCVSCNVTVRYRLDGGVRRLGGERFTFSRTLSLPRSPTYLSYEIFLPQDYTVLFDPQEPAMVPAASLVTDGTHIIVSWSERSPDLPKRYYLRFQGYEADEKGWGRIWSEFGEGPVWFILLVFFVIGAAAGAMIRHYFFRDDVDRELPFVPASLLSPDEKTLLRVLRKAGKMHQRELGKVLSWSKSKVSAVLANLDYKEIVKREKFGRNYVVELVKELEDF